MPMSSSKIARVILLSAFVYGCQSTSAPRSEGGGATSTGTVVTTAQLDELLDKEHFSELSKLLAKGSQLEEINSRLNWEKAKLTSGASSFVGFVYGRELWRLANGFEVSKWADEARTLRDTAGMVALYTYSLIILDLGQCKDVSAPVHRRDELMTWSRDALRYVVSLPLERQQKLVDIAVNLENRTASLRRNDGFLCSGGLDEMQYNFKSGAQPQEVATPPGQVGRTFEIPSIPGYKPSFVDEAAWREKQAKAREGLRAKLLALVKPSK